MMDELQWAEHQAAAIRAGRFDLVDQERVAAVLDGLITDRLGEFTERLASLLVALYLTEQERGDARVLDVLRLAVREDLKELPSVRSRLVHGGFVQTAWMKASGRLGLDYSDCPWDVAEIVGRE